VTIYLAPENALALSALVDRILASEGVIVTRGGKVLVETKASTLSTDSQRVMTRRA
jgi:hypothetical protein